MTNILIDSESEFGANIVDCDDKISIGRPGEVFNIESMEIGEVTKVTEKELFGMKISSFKHESANSSQVAKHLSSLVLS